MCERRTTEKLHFREVMCDISGFCISSWNVSCLSDGCSHPRYNHTALIFPCVWVIDSSLSVHLGSTRKMIVMALLINAEILELFPKLLSAANKLQRWERQSLCLYHNQNNRFFFFPPPLFWTVHHRASPCGRTWLIIVQPEPSHLAVGLRSRRRRLWW